MMSEEWRPVVGYEGWYDISNLGRVRRAREGHRTFVGRILKPSPDRGGYLQVYLVRDSKKHTSPVHRLVGNAFFGELPTGMQTNHINGNKNDNSVQNLEYVTPSQNMQHAFASGLKAALRGSDNGNSKLSEEQVLEIKNELSNGKSIREIALNVNISKSSVFSIKHRISWGWLNAC